MAKKNAINTTDKTHAFVCGILKKYKLFPKAILSLNENIDLLSKFSGHDLFAIQENPIEGVLGIKIYRQKIQSFRIPAKVQLILALDYLINTLPNQAARENIAQKTAEHLDPYWLCIFSIHTPKYYENRIKLWSTIEETDISTNIIQYLQKKNSYLEQKKSFVLDGDGKYIVTNTVTSAITFPISEIKKIFSAHFESVVCISETWSSVTPLTETIYVICQKSWNPGQ